MDVATGDWLDAGNGPQKRGFAGAIRSNQCNDFAGLHLK
jgi:hypothetical protein